MAKGKRRLRGRIIDQGTSSHDTFEGVRPDLPILATGIAWYTRESYPRCLAIFEDAADLPDTYDKWLALAERARDRERQLGRLVVEALIDPDAFKDFCAARGYRRNMQGRGEFANVQAYEAVMNQRKGNRE